MVNLPTKFEVQSITCHGHMKCVAKCEKWGGWGLPKVIGNVTIRWSAYDFLFIFNRNYASMLYCFQDTASYLLKYAKFDLPHLHLAPPLGVTPFEFQKDFWYQKTSVPGLSCGVVCVIVHLAVFV